jgi:hypothetical protein
MNMITRSIAIFALATSSAFADTWTGSVTIQSLQPLVVAEGGAIRVTVSATISTSLCGSTPLFDFVFTNGTQEANSALVAGLYMALATGSQITLLYSSSACSPYGAPMITGMTVN